MTGDSTFPLVRAARTVAVGLLLTLTLPALAQEDQGTNPPPAPTDQAPPPANPADATQAPPAAPAPAPETTGTVPVKPLTPEQASVPPPSKEAQQLETIEVTGSRLKRTDYESAQPVVSISREDIERTGLTDVNEILRHLSVAGNGSAIPQIGRTFLSLGEVNLDLRNLGAQHTLLLVNGRRWVTGLIATSPSTSDFNTIPLAIVERIEILKDGASAIYGSDAIGGVVNIITRKDYEGVGINLYNGMFVQQADGETQQADVSWGTTHPGQSFFLNLSYNNLDTAPTTNRWFTATSMPTAGVTRWSGTTERGRFEFIPNNANGSFYQCPNIGSGVVAGEVPNAQGRGLVNQTAVVPAGLQLCDLVLKQSSVGKTGAGSTSQSDYKERDYTDVYNKLANGSLTEPNQRTALFAQYTQELADHVSFEFQGLYNIRKSTTVSFNSAFGGGDLLFPSSYAYMSGISQNNPYNPFGQGIGLDSSCNGDPEFGPNAGTTCVGLAPGVGAWLMRLTNDRADEVFIQRVHTVRLGGTLKGDVEWFGIPLSWDGGYIYSASKLQETVPLPRFDLLGQELGNPDINGNPTTCNSPCVPLDVFHGQAGFNYQAVEYAYWDTNQRNRNRQDIGFFDIAGELAQPFSWMAGPIAVATGLEARRNYYQSRFDPFISTGLVALNIQNDAQAQTFAREAYVEFGVPIVKDLPFAHVIDLDIAGRYSRYPLFGSVTTGKAGLRWQPIDDLLVRGTYSTGFRAPNVAELYASPAQSGDALSDPCAAQNPDATTQSNCQADGAAGAPAAAAVNSPYDLWVGNQNLKPEHSKNLTYGLVYSPHFVRDLNFNLDFYKIQITDYIVVGTGQYFLDTCYRTTQRSNCQYIIRDQTGGLDHVVTPYFNYAEVDTSGVDMGADYILPLAESIGRIKLSIEGSYLNQWDYVTPQAVGGTTRTGAVGQNGGSFNGLPRWKAGSTVEWKRDLWNASWSTRMAYHMTEPCDDLYGASDPTVSYHNLGLCSDPNPHTDANGNTYYENMMRTVFYHNVQVGRELPTYNADITIGVNNVTNRNPAFSYSNIGFYFYNYDPSQYEVPGRFGYMRVGFKF